MSRKARNLKRRSKLSLRLDNEIDKFNFLPYFVHRKLPVISAADKSSETMEQKPDNISLIPIYKGGDTT